FVLAVAIPTATTLYTFRHRARYSSIEEPTSPRWPVLLLGMLTVIIVSAWPYLAAAPGNYWHSGNEDFFDANNGRNAFLQKEAAVLEYDFAVVHENSVFATTQAADAPQFSTPTDRQRLVT